MKGIKQPTDPRIQPSREFLQANPNKSKEKGLDFLGFIRPNRDFSMGYGEKNPTPVSGCVRNVSLPCAACLNRIPLSSPHRRVLGVAGSIRRIGRSVACISVFHKQRLSTANSLSRARDRNPIGRLDSLSDENRGRNRSPGRSSSARDDVKLS